MSQQASSLAYEWRRLTRLATLVAVLTSPAFFVVLRVGNHWSIPVSLLVTVIAVVAFRGLVDVIAHKLIATPNLYGAGQGLLEEDVVARRRTWYWRTRYRRLAWLLGFFFLLTIVANIGLRIGGVSTPIWATWGALSHALGPLLSQFGLIQLLGLLSQVLFLPLFFIFNFAILLGPLLVFGLKQMKGYEPGDADWGVKLDDVRGQTEPKQDVTRVISLWQSGEEFEKAGGKRERGLLFIGAPGTGKTMLSKAIATTFNSPIMTMPGSGFAQTFIGMDVAIVMVLIARARRLARKWGGQCVIFIDEIDAVGLRRQALGGGGTAGGFAKPADGPGSFHDHCFYGRNGALTPTGDLVLETRAWRERLFHERAPEPSPAYPRVVAGLRDRLTGFFPGAMGGMGGGGGMALNQLLVQMDGVDEPPFLKKVVTNRVNTFLDAMFIVPPKIGRHSLRLPKPKPRDEQIYFIGATNVPIDALDPALIRPGRMGRHIWFRTPTKDDRKDIFDLYINKVSHVADLDTDKRRDELARITNGYSPAMIEQVCSMALTYAHSEGRLEFGWPDIVEAMTTIESGTAQGIDYIPEETRAVAIHEAGHAAASHVYMKDVLSTRLSIRKRGGSLGHHQAIEKEERFSSWRSEEIGKLIWTLGAMAAERVFYGENSTGVGGDVQSATARAAWMVGACGMGPERVDLGGKFASELDEEEARKEIMERFERIGSQIMNTTGGGAFAADPLAGVLSNPTDRGAVAQLLGQAYVTAHVLIKTNRDKVGRVADLLIERRELHGDEVVDVLDEVDLVKPAIDLMDDATWPKL
ncbi:MAG TPA: AAA family ATPase [Solirubrobacteraceae bacterium]